MRVRAPHPSERVIITAFFDELAKAKADEEDRRTRNSIYSDVARRCGVTYDRVVDLCHDRLYVEKGEGVWFHGWKTGEI